MADRFKCDPQAAAQVARDLTQVRTDMTSMGSTFDEYDDATGSRRIRDALHEFFKDSSDSRKKMSDLLERAAGLLSGLAEGATAVDRGLADALDTGQPQPAGAASGGDRR
jgi:hypothetical protein